VDVSDKFAINYPSTSIAKDSFITCQSYKKIMDNQSRLLGALSITQQHHIEEIIKFGIPPEFRGKLWLKLTGINITNDDTTQFNKLTQSIDADLLYVIEKDLGRTFEIKDNTFTERLRRVLIAYSNHNPALGYCQSINILAATLLVFMPEDHAFWMLVYLLENVIPNFHVETMHGYLTALEVFKYLIASELPEIDTHFKKLNLDIGGITSPWFLSLFIHTMPHVTAFMVWDNILWKGPIAIFEAGLAILRMQQNRILEIDEFSDLMVYIRGELKELYNPTMLLKSWKPLTPEIFCFAKNAESRREEEIVKATKVLKTQFHTSGFLFKVNELQELWKQFVMEFPHLCEKDSGLDKKQFIQFITGTFSEWYLDRQLLDNLFQAVDINRDGVVDFSEIVCFLYVVCRGPFVEFAEFNLRLFDVGGKGWIDKSDLTRMLRSLYGMFNQEKRLNCVCYQENKFLQYMKNFANDIFKFPAISFSGVVTRETFRDVVRAQQQILTVLQKEYPTVRFPLSHSYFYWMNLFFSPSLSHSHSDMIKVSFDKSESKKLHVPLFSVSVLKTPVA